MPDQDKLSQNIIALLAKIELPEVSQTICRLAREISGGVFAALLFWDTDLETLTNSFLDGDKTIAAEKFIDAFADQFVSKASPLYKIDNQDFSESIPDIWQPLYCLEISDHNQLHACLLIANQHNKDPQAILASLQNYPLSLAISRTWEFRELQQENERLRGNYEEMEEKTRLLEEQTRKLIHDLTMKDTTRTKHVERERLIYSISNVVRSYMDIQKVLETTVDRIGNAFAVSRCLLIRAADHASGGEEPLQVFEYTKEAASVKDLFVSEEGINFAHAAFGLMRPQDLTEPFVDINHNLNRDFLVKLGFRSGLIVPLLLREHSLGVLFLHDCFRPRFWSIDDISLINSLADQISVAIENAELHQEQERQAITDGLTGIANRRSFSRTLAREFERAKRYKQPLSLILLDLDYLKVINDSFGHQVGDEAIKAVGSVLKQSSRSIDLAARYGGEEFCLLLPNTKLAMAEQLAERLRHLINELHLEGPGHISVSIGIASYPLHADDSDTLFRKADEALYEAKQAGRNLVKVCSSSLEDSVPRKNSTKESTN